MRNRAARVWVACVLVALASGVSIGAWAQMETNPSGAAAEADAALTGEGVSSEQTPPSNISESDGSKTTSQQPAIEEIERQVNDLKAEVARLESAARTASAELARQNSALADAQKGLLILSTVQKILHPSRLVSPILANIGFICAAIALLYIVLARPTTAQSLLSFRYPFSVRIRQCGSSAPEMGSSLRLFWIIALVFLLVMLAVPAFSQEAAVETGPASSQSSQLAPPTVSEPAPTVQSQMEQALKYAELTPIQRAIYALESLPENSSIKLVLELDVLQAINTAATKQGHAPLVEIPEPPKPVTMDLRKGTPGYYIVLASLYETEGRPTTCDTLVKGIQPFTVDPATLKSGLTFAAMRAMLQWLGACNSTDLVKVMIAPAAEMSPDAAGVELVVETASKLGLSEELRKALEVNVSKFTDIDSVEALADLAHKMGHSDLAMRVLEENITKFNFDSRLRVIRKFHALGETTKTESLLGQSTNGADLEGMLRIVDVCAELGFTGKAGEVLGLAVQRAYDGTAVDTVLAAAAKHECLQSVIVSLGGSIRSRQSMADWGVRSGVPEAFGTALVNKEESSLACIVAAYLYAVDSTADLKAFFEEPVVRQLDVIIKSLGAKSQMRINDLYILARYYELTGNSALDATRQMVALQQRLRGFDTAALAEADARRLAFMMELEQLRTQQEELKKAIDDAEAQARLAREQRTEVRFNILVLVLEAVGKAILMLLGLWIAFSRGVAAARDAHSWRFSQFCWRFLETIGFECCCTLVMLPAGVPLTLVSQDRLKHLSIMEIQKEPFPSKEKPVPLMEEVSVPDGDHSERRALDDQA